MRTILMPGDFSATCANALQYVTEQIRDIEVSRIMLSNNYYKSVYEHDKIVRWITQKLLQASFVISFITNNLAIHIIAFKYRRNKR
jgi:hypothetical protein